MVVDEVHSRGGSAVEEIFNLVAQLIIKDIRIIFVAMSANIDAEKISQYFKVVNRDVFSVVNAITNSTIVVGIDF